MDIVRLSTNFQESKKILWHDKILAKTILKLFPKNILPNHLTIFRMALTPVVATLMLYHHYYIGLIAFLLVALTDALDGSMARTRNQITEWGKIYDPLADKILIGSTVAIIVFRYIDIWTAFIIIGIELIFIPLAWVRTRKGINVEANLWGKIKMILEVLGITILLLAVIFNWAALLPLASNVLYVAIAFAIISLLAHGT